jgi:dihydrolipoamide dehydrogenase
MVQSQVLFGIHLRVFITALARKPKKLANEQFDVTIIGSGPGGMWRHSRRQLGLRRNRRERQPLGGNVHAARLHSDEADVMSAHVTSRCSTPATSACRRRDSTRFADVQKTKRQGGAEELEGHRVSDEEEQGDGFKGTGKLALPGKVEVTDAEARKQTLETKNIIIATGSLCGRFRV